MPFPYTGYTCTAQSGFLCCATSGSCSVVVTTCHNSQNPAVDLTNPAALVWSVRSECSRIDFRRLKRLKHRLFNVFSRYPRRKPWLRLLRINIWNNTWHIRSSTVIRRVYHCVPEWLRLHRPLLHVQFRLRIPDYLYSFIYYLQEPGIGIKSIRPLRHASML